MEVQFLTFFAVSHILKSTTKNPSTLIPWLNFLRFILQLKFPFIVVCVYHCRVTATHLCLVFNMTKIKIASRGIQTFVFYIFQIVFIQVSPVQNWCPTWMTTYEKQVLAALQVPDYNYYNHMLIPNRECRLTVSVPFLFLGYYYFFVEETEVIKHDNWFRK